MENGDNSNGMKGRKRKRKIGREEGRERQWRKRKDEEGKIKTAKCLYEHTHPCVHIRGSVYADSRSHECNFYRESAQRFFVRQYTHPCAHVCRHTIKRAPLRLRLCASSALMTVPPAEPSGHPRALVPVTHTHAYTHQRPRDCMLTRYLCQRTSFLQSLEVTLKLLHPSHDRKMTEPVDRLAAY